MMKSGPRQPTIYDLARASRVSISTVSRVINSPEKVSAETRKKVTDAMDRLNYVPKAEARARALRSNHRIGVITPFFTAPSFVQRLRGVASALAKTSYELVIFPVDSVDRLQTYLSVLPIAGNLDGIIVISLPVTDEDVRHIIDRRLPAALIEYPHPLLNCVEIDDFQGGKLAAEFLIKKGHHRIAFLGDTDLPEYAIHPVSLRLQGFRKTLQEAGIDLPEELVRLAPYDEHMARRVAEDLLGLADRPSAVFAATDLQALGVLKAARQLGIRVPDDLAIIGFDDIDMADFEDLTTIRQNLDESGRLAVEILISHIDDSSRPVQHTELPLTVVERLSA